MISTSTNDRFTKLMTPLCFVLAALSSAATAETTPQPDPDNPDLAGRFSGQVLGPGGKPFRGAQVYVVPISKDLSGQMVPADEIGPTTVRATTGADGRFDIHASDVTLIDLDGLPTNRLCLVLATAEGYGPDWAQVRGRTRSSTIRHPTRATDLKLQLVADDVPVSGRILGPDGKPLADAHVQLGSIMIPKRHDLDAHVQRAIERLRANKGRDLPFYSTPSYEKYFSYPRLLPSPITVRTDAEGRFTLTGIGNDRLVQLKVSARSMLDSYVGAITRTTPSASAQQDGKYSKDHIDYYREHGARLTFQLKPGRTISGVVIDSKTRRPIAGMLVGTGHEGYPRDGVRGHRTVTDASGRFHITGLDPQIEKWAITAMSPPGMAYQSASVNVEDDSPTEIACEPGIPFRLQLTDEQGQPVDAEVSYFEVLPNPHGPKVYCFPSFNPISETLKGQDGTYSGFALPGPGVILVKTSLDFNYLPPMVDPRAFFAEGKPPAIPGQAYQDYGNQDSIHTVMGMTRQNNYAAIVLVNPAPDSPPLELAATIKKGTPRQVTLVDPQGQPIVGVKTNGLTEYGYEPPLRAATFPLLRLHPDREKRIIFQHEDRKLTAYLVARGDSAEPYTVTLHRWARIKGRFVDETGSSLPLGQKDTIWEQSLHVKASLPGDPDYRHAQYADVDNKGQFTLDELIPGQAYDGLVYQNQGPFSNSAFTELVLKPGETRDLGDIRLTIQSLAKSAFPIEAPLTMDRKDLGEPFAMALLGGLTHYAPAARLPLVTGIAIDGR